jgi:ubiquinone/menaquinone biosynthesis C-methylase UbiE
MNMRGARCITRKQNTMTEDIPRMDEFVSKLQAAYARRDREIPADRYARTTPSEICNQHEREYRMMLLLKDAGLGCLENKKILDVGCGRGATLRLLLEYGAQPANLFGIDLLEDRIERARGLNSRMNFNRVNATQIPFPDGSFDLVIQFTSFSSILDESIRTTVAAEIQRVLGPAGKFLSYDFMFNNPKNPDVTGIKPAEIRRLFPGYRMTGRRITLAPPLGRLVARVSYPLYHLTAQIRPLCTHYLCVLEKSQSAAKGTKGKGSE